MLSKLKNNLGLIATAIALMGSIGAGLSTAADIVNTLQGIDDRMNQVEVDFEMLKESTFVQNDIAVLYEKIQQLEMAAQNVGRFNEEMAALQTNLMNLEQNYYDLKFDTEQSLRDSGFDLDRYYLLEKWEYQDLNDSMTRIQTQIESVNQNIWQIDDLKNRLAWLEANNHNH
jgi:predicted RNase H-like nuclease (RuvC/YqgF family)